MTFKADHAAVARAGLPIRRGRAEIRAGLRSGKLDIADVVFNPPECLHGLNTHEVVSWTRGVGRIGMESLNRKALLEGINLMVRIERASRLTREWVAENVIETRSQRRAVPAHGELRTFRRWTP